MKTIYKTMWLYWLIQALGFYLLPLLIKDTGSAMLLMLIVLPALSFLCAIAYGLRHGLRGWHALYSLSIAILFAPSIFLYYNASAWVYVVVYAGIALAGHLIGRIFYKRA